MYGLISIPLLGERDFGMCMLIGEDMRIFNSIQYFILTDRLVGPSASVSYYASNFLNDRSYNRIYLYAGLPTWVGVSILFMGGVATLVPRILEETPVSILPILQV